MDVGDTLLVAVVKKPDTTMAAELATVANGSPKTATAATVPITRSLRSNLFSSGIARTDPIG